MHSLQTAAEYASADAFAAYAFDDERETFTADDLAALNYRTRAPVRALRAALEAYGLRLAPRAPARRVRGFTTSSHDRWYGPGSDRT